MNNRKILVVDDSLVILRTLSQKLRAAGYNVATAEDGEAALVAARSDKPDLILLDINFPPHAGSAASSWDGFLLMEWLHRIEETRHVPVIIMTSSDQEAAEPRALSSGAVAFFPKPIDHKRLLERIREVLQEQPAAC